MPLEHRLLRRAAYRSVPWKNGGGITHEVLRVPADTSQYDWRVSVAQIDRAGPFSDFHGYARHMALLAGNGVRLRFAHGERELRRPGDLVEFDGGDAVECELRDGSCTDLNLMVAKTLAATARMLTALTPVALEAAPGKTAFLFALGPVHLSSEGIAAVHLERWDSLWWRGGALRLAAADAGADGTPSVVFFATIGHGRPSPAHAHRS